MSKKPAKPAADPNAAPKKRSKLKLALLARVPLLLAGGGYGGWVFYSGQAGEHAAQAAEAEAHPAEDPIQVSAVPTEIAAETSFTHSYALSVMIARDCGRVRAEALKAASEEEARADGMLVNLSWTAAARRTALLDDKICRRLLNEVYDANVKAVEIAAAKAAPEKGGKAAAHH